jgi:hypothetical protein
LSPALLLPTGAKPLTPSTRDLTLGKDPPWFVSHHSLTIEYEKAIESRNLPPERSQSLMLFKMLDKGINVFEPAATDLDPAGCSPEVGFKTSLDILSTLSACVGQASIQSINAEIKSF